MTDRIVVGTDHVHKQIDLSEVADVHQAWRQVTQELALGGEHGVNNNQLKELFRVFAIKAQRLHSRVENLPAQGRHITMSGSTTMFSADTFKSVLEEQRRVQL